MNEELIKNGKISKLNSLFSIEGRTAIVTGALGLIGTHHSSALSEAGANVIVCDKDLKRCEEFAEVLPGRAFGYSMDVTDPESIRSLRSFIEKQFGRLDILVNNAAINDMFENKDSAFELSKFEHYPLEMWERSMKVNLTGVFLCSQILGTLMLDKNKGSIINVASTYGIVAPDQSLYKNPDGSQSFYKSPVYSTTKGAVLSFTKYLASYWGSSGIRVNALSPGGVENGQEEYFINKYSSRTPIGRMAHPEDYRGAVVFLASDASSYMTGANIVVDGGWTIC
jgi:NAD(P)-dependent dehydrogenase (short-subunit alcohol dehydrogenase family)